MTGETRYDLQAMFYRLIDKHIGTTPDERERMRRDVSAMLIEAPSIREALRLGMRIVNATTHEDRENIAEMLQQRTAGGIVIGLTVLRDVVRQARGPLEALVALTYAVARLRHQIAGDPELNPNKGERAVESTIDFILETVKACACEELGETEADWTAALDKIAVRVRAKNNQQPKDPAP